MSDLIPNSFLIPNAIVDRLMFLLTDGEFRVLMYTIRHVLGWEKKRQTLKATISLSNYVNGFSYTDKEGKTVKYNGCGMKEAAVRSALKSLETYRILSKSDEVTQHGREYELAFLSGNDVDFVGLELRISNKDNRDKKQMEAAREVNPKLNPTPSVEQEEGGSVEQEEGGSVEQETTKYNIEIHVEKQSSAPTAPASVTDAKPVQEKLTKPEQDAWYEAVKTVWGFVGGRNHDYQKFARGEHTKKQFAEYKLARPFKSPAELLAWGVYEKRKRPNLNMIESPAKVQSSVDEWMEKRKFASQPAKIIYAEPVERPSALDGIVTFEKPQKKAVGE